MSPARSPGKKSRPSLASRSRVIVGLRVREQLRNAPPQLQGYVAGVVAFLRADSTAASAAFTVLGGAEHKTVVFSFAGGHGFLDYQVFEEQRVVVLADLIWLE
jgi:hypothetical protein